MFEGNLCTLTNMCTLLDIKLVQSLNWQHYVNVCSIKRRIQQSTTIYMYYPRSQRHCQGSRSTGKLREYSLFRSCRTLENVKKEARKGSNRKYANFIVDSLSNEVKILRMITEDWTMKLWTELTVDTVFCRSWQLTMKVVFGCKIVNFSIRCCIKSTVLVM